MKIKFVKDYQGNKKGDVVDPGNDTWAQYLVNKGLAKETDEALTHHAVKEKNDKAGPNGKK